MDWHCNYRFAHQGQPIVDVDGFKYCILCAPTPPAEPEPEPEEPTEPNE